MPLQSMSIWIVVPTYNEKENLERMVRSLTRIPETNVLVVDDNSPDGTGKLAEQLRRSYPMLSVLHRPAKTGLADAYRDGLSYAIEHGADRLVHLDADGSHDPSLVPTLVTNLKTADLVIASRYIQGGSIDIPWYRRVISLVGNAYLRLMLGREIRDWSTGYKAWRSETLTEVLKRPWVSHGYAGLMEMSWWAKKNGARMVETPLKFTERRAGHSKFSWRIAWENIRVAWELRHLA